MSHPQLSSATRVFYGFGSVAYGVKDNGFGFFLLLYYNQVLGLSAQLASLAIFVALCIDAISDPIVGGVSDRLHARWGRRHPFMYGAVLPVALAYFLLWNPPQLAETALFLYLLATAVLVRTLITFFEVPSTALGPELTDDYDERTLLMSIRYFFGWSGGIALSVFTYAFLFVETPEFGPGQLNPRGYETYGVLAAAIMAVAMLVSALGTHSQIPRLKAPPPRRAFSPRQTARELRETLSNRSFFALFGYGIFAAMAGGLAAAMNIYLNTFFWGLGAQQIAWLVPSSFVSAALALFFTPRLSARFGKQPAAVRISLAAATFAPVPIGLRLLGFMPPNGTTELLLALIAYNVIEVALVIMSQTLVSAMLADVVEQSELSTGRRSEGIFFAARSFISKSLSGAGILGASLLLMAVGFPDDATPGSIEPAVLVRLGAYYAPAVMLLYLASVACLLAYSISREDHEENLRRLREAR